MILQLTVKDIMEPLAERLYDNPTKQKWFLNQDYLQKQADNTTVIQAIEEVQAMIEITLAGLVDPITEAPRFKSVLMDLDKACLKLSDNFADSDAWLDVDISGCVDDLDG